MSNECVCKICREGYADTVAQLVSDNTSLTNIQNHLKIHFGLSVTINLIKRHLETLGLSYAESKSEKESEVIPTKLIDENNFITANLDRLDPNDFSDTIDKTSTNSIVGYLQEKYLGLLLLQTRITWQHLLEFESGYRDKPPTAQINNLHKLFTLYNSVTGIDLASNQQSAIQTVLSMGYKINAQLPPNDSP